MCKSVEAILEQATVMPVRCEVTMDGKGIVSDDFVTIMVNEEGHHTLVYNTDFVTLAIAADLIGEAMEKMLSEMPAEDIEELERIIEEGIDE